MSGEFHAFELAGWRRAAGPYQTGFLPLTAQAIPALLAAVHLTPGRRLLDLATGPGAVVAAAQEKGAEAHGLDFSETMVAEAQRRYPGLRFMQGDAQALPLADGEYDAVTCNFGLLHLAEPEKAIAEAYRVLRPGGRFAFTVWAPPPETAGFAIVLDAVSRYGQASPELPEGPPFFRFSEAGESERCLEHAGFQQIGVTRVAQTWRLAHPGELFETMLTAAVRTRALLEAQPAAVRAQIAAATEAAAAEWRRDGHVCLPMPAVLCSGLRP